MGRRLILVCVVLVMPSVVGADGSRWWLDPMIQQELRLLPRQVAAIDAVYRRTLPERRALRQRLDREERELRIALALGNLDDAAAAVLVDRVEDARARRNVARTSLLVRIYLTLDADQRRKIADVSGAGLRSSQ